VDSRSLEASGSRVGNDDENLRFVATSCKRGIAAQAREPVLWHLGDAVFRVPTEFPRIHY
jgi:hypothetical protein